MKRKVVVAVTGASGSIYAYVLLKKLEMLCQQWDQVGLVMSDNARAVWKFELGLEPEFASEIKRYGKNDFSAPFASGSAGFNVMFVVPCSMGTLGRIAHGISNDLITRAADVMLKERGKLILIPRDTPFHLIQLENMRTLTLAGAIICPAIPSFYSKPQTFEDLAATVVDRALALAGFELTSYRWGEKNDFKTEEF